MGDILISVRAPVGPTNVADVKCCIGRGLAAIRPRTEADRDFVLAGLRLFEDDLKKLGSGSTFGAIKRDDLESLEIPLPPLAEQKRIAVILNEQMAAVERARAAAEARLEAAKALPAAYLRAVFSSPEAQRWPKKRVQEVCSVHPGQHILEADYARVSGGIGYLTGPADFGERIPTIARWTEKPKAWCEPGDVLVTVKGAGVGKINVAPNERVAIDRQLMAIRPKPGLVDQLFLYLVMTTHFFKLQTDALGSTVPGLGREDIEHLELPLPSLICQQEIAARVDEQIASADRARKAIEEELDTINKLPATLLRRAFSGEL